MPLPLSQEMRERIIYHKKVGAKNADIINWLRVSKNSITRIWKQYKEKKQLHQSRTKKDGSQHFATRSWSK